MPLRVPGHPQAEVVAWPDEGHQVRSIRHAVGMGFEICLPGRVPAHGQDILYPQGLVAVQHGKDVLRAQPIAGEVGQDLQPPFVLQLLDELARAFPG